MHALAFSRFAASAAAFFALSISCSKKPAPQREVSPNASSTAREPAPAAKSPPVHPGARDVTLLGTLVQRDGDEVEVCPAGQVARCPGFRVVGEVPAQAISTSDDRSVWRLEGRLAGEELFVTKAIPEPNALQTTDYFSPCLKKPEEKTEPSGSKEGLARERELANPPVERVERIAAFRKSHPDIFAGDWWDARNQTFVISVTRDKERAEQELREALPKARLCVTSAARHTLAELEQARKTTNVLLTRAGVQIIDMSLDLVGNRYLYFVEAISRQTWESIEREMGDAVKVVPFIAVDGAGELPALPNKGTVMLETQATRSNVQMGALGVFSVQYDPRLTCIYLKSESGERVLPVWPLGYWATHDPLQVYDFDNRLVASRGKKIEFGGGEVPIETYHAENLCGAESVWIGAPTQDVGPTGGRSSPRAP